MNDNLRRFHSLHHGRSVVLAWMVLCALATGRLGVHARAGENPSYASASEVGGEEQLKIAGDGDNEEIDLGRGEGGIPKRAKTLYVPAKTVIVTDDQGVERRLKRGEITVTITNPDTRAHPTTGEKPKYYVDGLGARLTFPDDGDGGGYSKKVILSPGTYTATMSRNGEAATQRVVPVVVYGVFVSGQVAYSWYGDPYLTHPLANAWKTYVGVNDGDADGDRIPDFADGFGTFGDASKTSGGRTTRDILIELQPGESLRDEAWDRAKVKLTYAASDPAAVEAEASDTEPPFTAYQPAEGTFRLWRYSNAARPEGQAERNRAPVPAGEWLPADGEFTVRALFGESTKVLLRLEGVQGGEDALKVEYRPNDKASPAKDEEAAAAVQANLTGDANLDGATDEFDDAIEGVRDIATRPGPITFVNDADLDRDGIIDAADGFLANPNIADSAMIGRDGDGGDGGDDDVTPKFTELTYTLKGVVDPSKARVMFTYLGADPSLVTLAEDPATGAIAATVPTDYVPNNTQGRIRLWTKDAPAARDMRSAGNGGDYVKPGEWIAGDSVDGTLYVEGVTAGEVQIVVSVDPDGKEGSDAKDKEGNPVQNAGVIHSDTLWVSVHSLAVDLVGHTPAAFPAKGLSIGERWEEDTKWTTLFVNSDDDTGNRKRDLDRDIALGIVEGDDEIMTLILRKVPDIPGLRFNFRREGGDGTIRLFDRAGTQPVDLPMELETSVPGESPLAALLEGDVWFRLEGLAKKEKATFVLECFFMGRKVAMDKLVVVVDEVEDMNGFNRGSVLCAEVVDGGNGYRWVGATLDNGNPLNILLPIPDNWRDADGRLVRGAYLSGTPMIPSTYSYYGVVAEYWNVYIDMWNEWLAYYGYELIPYYSADDIVGEIADQTGIDPGELAAEDEDGARYLITLVDDPPIYSSGLYDVAVTINQVGHELNGAVLTTFPLVVAHLDLDADTNNDGDFDENANEDALENVVYGHPATPDLFYPGVLVPVNTGTHEGNRALRGNAPVATSDYAPDQESGHRIVPSDPQLRSARFKLHIEDIWVEAGARIRWKITNAQCIKLWRGEEHGLIEIPNGSVSPLWADQGDGKADPSFGTPLDLWIEGIAEGWGTIRAEMILPHVNKVVAYDEIRFTVYDFDLDIDSLNRGEYEGPDHSPEEDAAEESEGLFNWKRLSINTDDADGDGLPGYMDWEEADNQFVPFTLKIPDPMQGEERNPFASKKAYIRFAYSASNPALLDANAQPVVLPPGHLRIWKKDADEARDVVDDFIQTDEWYAWDELATDGMEVPLYVEAVREFGLRTIEVDLLYGEDIEDYDTGLYFLNPFDSIRLTTIAPLDLAIDSLNTGRFNGPQLTPEEDTVENTAGLSGKVIITSQGDVNGNGIPDFADGIGKFPKAATTGVEDFVPIRLTLPTELDASRLRIRFVYNASDPANVSYDEEAGKYTPASGQMRVWTKQGTEPRNYGDVGAEVPGNFVKPEVYYTCQQLDTDLSERRSSTFFVEAVRSSESVGGDKISVEAYYLDDSAILRKLNADIIQCTFIQATLGGTLVYDPKLESAGTMALHGEIAIPRNDEWAMSGRLALYSGTNDVVCFLEKDQVVPKGRLECSWDGKYGAKTADSPRGTPGHPDPIGKYADPGTYTLRFDAFLPGAEVPFHTVEIPIMLVRLGPASIDFEGAQPYKFHVSRPAYTKGTGTGAITLAYNSADRDVDHYWKIKNLDFKKLADANAVARLEVSHKGEAYNNESNNRTPDAANAKEKYIDADGNGAYSPDLVQVNFPRLVYNGTTFVEDTAEFNYPAIYIKDDKPIIVFDMGSGLSDIQVTGTAPNLTPTVVAPGYSNTSRYPIRVVPAFKGSDMVHEVATGFSAGYDLDPGGAKHKFKADTALTDNVGTDVETVTFKFQYNATGERFVDANSNGKHDAGETVVPAYDHNGNGEYDENWQDIPGSYKTTHYIYRLAAAPTADAIALSGGRLYLKIVDFTCKWGNSKTNSQDVFNEIWNGTNFWTPITGTGTAARPNNGSGFHGKGDPTENKREDKWNNKPKCYTYEHDMTLPGGGGATGFDVDYLIDNNAGRCGAWMKFLIAFAGTHGHELKELGISPRHRCNRGGTITYLTTAQLNGGGFQVGDVVAIAQGFEVVDTVNGQANPKNQPKLARGFVDHALVYRDSDGNGRYDTGEMIYDPSYEHAGGLAYSSLDNYKTAAFSRYFYSQIIRVTAVDAAGEMTATVEISRNSPEATGEIGVGP